MKKLTAVQQRFFDNVVLVAALGLIFNSLKKFGVPLFLLGEVANTTSGGTPDRSVIEYYGGNIPWIKSGELNDGLIEESEECITDLGLQNSSAKVYPKGTLVVALYGATVGKTGILGINAASNQAVCAINPTTNKISTNFLFWFLRYERPDFLISSFGAAQPNISQKVLRETWLPMPTVELQREICNFLDIVEQRQKGKKNLLQPNLPPPLSDIGGKIARIEELAAKIGEARALKSTTLNESMNFWKVLSRIARETDYPIRTIEEMVEFLDSHRIPLSEAQRADRKGQYPYYGASGIIDYIDDYIFDEELLLLSEDGANLINRSTPIAFIAKGKYWVNNHAHVLKPLPGIVNIRFLAYALSDYNVSIFNFASAQAKLNQSNARKIAFPLPPLTEQLRIVNYLDSIQTRLELLKQVQSETSAELDALLPSILDKAFKGEL